LKHILREQEHLTKYHLRANVGGNVLANALKVTAVKLL
jgi:hypothetical protein